MRSAIAVLGLLASTGLASAADLGGPIYGGSMKDDFVPPPPIWTGFYFGGHVGYGWGDTDALTIIRELDGSIPMVPPDFTQPGIARNSYDVDGWLGGLQLGYNYQSGRLVIGIEGDYSWSDVDGSFVYDRVTGPHKRAGGGIDWLATIRGRAGFTFDNVLVYGTAGVAFTKLKGYINNLYDLGEGTFPGDRGTASTTETGWVAGGGVEIAFTQNVTLRGEYLYFDFSDNSGTIKSPNWQHTVDADTEVKLHTLRLGLNYKFGG